MRGIQYALAMSLLTPLIAVCGPRLVPGGPDLIVAKHKIHTAPGNPGYYLKFTVKNIGKKPSRPTTAYINAINPSPAPGKNEIRIQRSVNVPALNPGAISGSLQTKFDIRQLRAERVSMIRIIVDPKNVVHEANESNNTTKWSWP